MSAPPFPSNHLAIVWFRIGDLRLTDHAPLCSALESNPTHLLPFFCLDRHVLAPLPLQGLPATGPHRFTAILRAVKDLKQQLEQRGCGLITTKGDTGEQFQTVFQETAQHPSSPFSHVSLHYYSDRYKDTNIYYLTHHTHDWERRWREIKDYGDEWGSSRKGEQEEEAVSTAFTSIAATLLNVSYSIHPHASNGGALYHPDDVTAFIGDDVPTLLDRCSTMTAFRQTIMSNTPVRAPLQLPNGGGTFPPLPNPIEVYRTAHCCYSSLRKAPPGGLPALPITEQESISRLVHLLDDSSTIMKEYQQNRMLVGIGDVGEEDASALLSVALSIGTLSPRVAWHMIEQSLLKHNNEDTPFCWQEPTKTSPGHLWLLMHLGIRDYFIFSALRDQYLLYTSGGPAQKSDMPWMGDGLSIVMTASQKQAMILFGKYATAQTGIPFLDASIHQLKATGYISNRSRQNLASFLSTTLQLDWRMGAIFFESYLIDHQPALNLENWAYVSGVGRGGQGRVFKTVTQGERYDFHGRLVRKYLPDLAAMVDRLVDRNEEISSTEEKEERRRLLLHRPWAGTELERKALLSVYVQPMIDPSSQIGKGKHV